MINRHYFMSVEKPHGDGTGSYSFDAATISYRSLFPDPKKIFDETSEHFKEKIKDIKGDKIQVISFNRI